MKNNKIQVEIVPMTDLVPDSHNANKGTARGNAKLEESIQMYGHGRSGLIDKNNKLIAGNKFYEKSGELGTEKAIVIKSDGHLPVFVQRVDLDLDADEEARLLAYYDNAVAQMDLEWDKNIIAQDLEFNIPLDKIWTPDEISNFLGVDETPYIRDNVKKTDIKYIVKVECSSEEAMEALYDRLVSEGYGANKEIE